jgi:hypothetical protein
MSAEGRKKALKTAVEASFGRFLSLDFSLYSQGSDTPLLYLYNRVSFGGSLSLKFASKTHRVEDGDALLLD